MRKEIKTMGFKKLASGRALYTQEDKVWIARGMSFFAIDYNGKRVSKKYCVGSFLKRLLSINRLSRQLLREGIHHLLPLKNADILVSTKKQVFIVSPEGKIKNIFTGYSGNKPVHQGICVTADGTIFFGEYTLNFQRLLDTRLYRSTDNGQNFECILTMSGKDIRHIHFVKYDPYEKCLWLGTGDEDFENKLMKSTDNGDSWQTVGEGSQDWRAVGVCFDENYLVWGTDAGSVPDQNHIIRMDRKTNKLEILADAEGPCHGCASFKNGRVFISTGVEGGQNEKDNIARLKELKDNSPVDVLTAKKDIFPLILQYGVMRFPLGTENTDKIVFTQMALKGGGEKIFIEI